MSESFEKVTSSFLDYFPFELTVNQPFIPNGEIALAYGIFEYKGWNIEVEVSHEGYVYYLVTPILGGGSDDDLEAIDSVMASVQRDHAKIVRLIEEKSPNVSYYQ